LPSGEKAERELSQLEREFLHIKESEFSKLGLYKKTTTNEATLFKLFQSAQPRNKADYSACVFAMNHFYNFGVDFNHFEFASRWLSTAIETSRVDEAVEIVKTWHTWLPHPPRPELIDILVGMVKIEQSREIVTAMRENWQMQLSPTSYTILIAKEIGLCNVDPAAALEAFAVWKDAVSMEVRLPEALGVLLASRLKELGRMEEAVEVQATVQRTCTGGIPPASSDSVALNT
jgi:hypothetical protein